VIKLRERTELS